jgi:hypothetical protein
VWYATSPTSGGQAYRTAALACKRADRRLRRVTPSHGRRGDTEDVGGRERSGVALQRPSSSSRIESSSSVVRGGQPGAQPPVSGNREGEALFPCPRAGQPRVIALTHGANAEPATCVVAVLQAVPRTHSLLA